MKKIGISLIGIALLTFLWISGKEVYNLSKKATENNMIMIVKQIYHKKKIKEPKNWKEFTTEYMKTLCN